MPFDTTAAKTAKQQLAAAASAKTPRPVLRDDQDRRHRAARPAGPRRRVPDEPQAPTTERETLDLELFENAHRLPAAIAAGSSAAATGHVLPAGPDLQGGSPELVERRHAVHALVERQPDEVAELLRGWLADRRG